MNLMRCVSRDAKFCLGTRKPKYCATSLEYMEDVLGLTSKSEEAMRKL